MTTAHEMPRHLAPPEPGTHLYRYHAYGPGTGELSPDPAWWLVAQDGRGWWFTDEQAALAAFAQLETEAGS